MDFRIADTFTDSLARLTGDEQKVVKTTAFDLQLNPVNPGMSFHKLSKAKDKRFWSVRVSQDIRLIVHRTDDSGCRRSSSPRTSSWTICEPDTSVVQPPDDGDSKRDPPAADDESRRVRALLHHDGGIDARVPVSGLLRGDSGGPPALSPQARRREGSVDRVRRPRRALPSLSRDRRCRGGGRGFEEEGCSPPWGTRE